jgi:selenocysteine lyase/cysteine desulfurase
MKNHLSTVSINVEGMDAGNVGTWLDVNYNIATRTGLHCAPLVHKQIGTLEKHGAVRFSIGAFNTDDDIDAAVNAVAEIAAWVRERSLQAK